VRTTVTLDPDTAALIRKRMTERGASFKQTVNDAIRDGLVGAAGTSGFRTKTANLGVPSVDLDKALQLAADLEDQELVRRMGAGG